MARKNTSPAIRSIRSHSGSFILVLSRSRFQCVRYRAEKFAPPNRKTILTRFAELSTVHRARGLDFHEVKPAAQVFLRALQGWQGRVRWQKRSAQRHGE